jgi:hypothetical protein
MSTPTDSLSPIVEQLRPQIEQMLLLLNQKEKHVIEERFDLNSRGRKTLEDIGNFYNVTRERIRQIEKTALSKLKRNIENFIVNGINDQAYAFLSENGGIAKADHLISFILKGGDEFSKASILLILSLDKRFEYISNTIRYFPYFKLNQLENDLIDKICIASIKLLNERKQLTDLKDVLEAVKASGVNYTGLNNKMILSTLFTNKEFKIVNDRIGLMEWRQINPRTLRDKIYFILRKSGKSLHFVDISNTIIQENFDKKNVNMQAVHNELIRHPDFVLIGRGIYALKEWGYEHGTVADIITQVLKEKESLSEAEIIEAVLVKRKVKPITIILNLKNKKQFVRVGRKQYSLK